MEVLLQEAHANPNIESKSTCSTALIQAIKIKNMGAIKTLMKGGANACQVRATMLADGVRVDLREAHHRAVNSDRRRWRLAACCCHCCRR